MANTVEILMESMVSRIIQNYDQTGVLFISRGEAREMQEKLKLVPKALGIAINTLWLEKAQNANGDLIYIVRGPRTEDFMYKYVLPPVALTWPTSVPVPHQALPQGAQEMVVLDPDVETTIRNGPLKIVTDNVEKVVLYFRKRPK